MIQNGIRLEENKQSWQKGIEIPVHCFPAVHISGMQKGEEMVRFYGIFATIIRGNGLVPVLVTLGPRDKHLDFTKFHVSIPYFVFSFIWENLLTYKKQGPRPRLRSVELVRASFTIEQKDKTKETWMDKIFSARDKFLRLG